MSQYKFIGGDGKEYGPYSGDQMRQFVAENRLTAQSQVSANGGPMQPAANYPEIIGAAPTAVPAPAPAVVAPPPGSAAPQPQPQPGYPQPHAGGGHLKPDRGTLILVLGILSLVGCGLFTGIPAWVMGNGDLKEIDAGRMNPGGRGSTNAGKICGMISVILTCVCGGGYAALILFAAAAGA